MSEYFDYHTNKHRFDGNDFERSSAITASSKHYCNREPREQARSLQLFKDMIGASVNFAFKDKSCCTDESFLNRFLYARKFQLDAANQLLINYLTYLKHHRTKSYLLQKLNIFDDHIQLALKDGNPAVLRQRDRRGRKVLLFAAANWEPSKYTVEDVYRAFLLTLDKLLENVQNMALGFVVIVDWTNFTFKQSTQLSPKVLKIMIEGLQDCMPAKFKGIHFISQPWYVDIALAVIKPFLNENTKKRLMIHGSNLSTLHDLITKDILPTDLGGEGPCINTLDWYHYLLESSQIESAASPKYYRLIQTEMYARTPALDEGDRKDVDVLCDLQDDQKQQLLLST